MYIGIIYTCWCKYLYPMNIWPHLHNTSNILSNTMTAENAHVWIRNVNSYCMNCQTIPFIDVFLLFYVPFGV